MKKFLLIPAIMALILFAASCAPKPAGVEFGDPVLESMIREALNKPEGVITVAEAEAVEGLKLGLEWRQDGYPAGTQITDAGALKYFVNLKRLDLSFHAVTDISPLKRLTMLEELQLGGNRISDISPIAGMTELRGLALFNCEAEDYGPLRNLGKLDSLYIDWSTFGDLGVLSGLTELRILSIAHTRVRDLAPLAGLTKLQSLKLEGCHVKDYSPLKSLYANLKEKDFELTETAGTAAKPGVVTFNDAEMEKRIRAVLNKPGGDITLAEAAAVKKLDINNQSFEDRSGKIRDISALEYFSNLEELDIAFHDIWDLKPLSGLTNLTALVISGCQVTDLTPLQDLTKMKVLVMSFGNRIKDLQALAGMKELEALDAKDIGIRDISALAELPKLWEIQLNGNEIRDIAPLAKLSGLKTVLLDGNPIADYTPLKDIYPRLEGKDFKIK